MRSFFRKPSWANTGNGNSSPEFYRRADQTYGDIVAASREARIRSINHGCDLSPGDEQASKGQDFMEEDHLGDVTFSISPETKQVTEGQCNAPISKVTSPSEKSEDNARRSSSTKAPKSSDMNMTSVLSLGTKSSLQGQPSPHSPCVANTPTPRTTRQDFLATPTHELDRGSDDESLPTSDINRSEPHEDVVVQILISSRIANTKSLVIKRKVYQPLKDVRLAWCKQQNLPRELHPFVFLTWKGRRLFDVTTCKSLGSHANRDLGTSTFDDDPSDNCADIHIHMEAVMDDQAPYYPLASSNHFPGQHLEKPANFEDKTECHSIRLVFKCPGHANYDIYASFHTRISQLITVYRDMHNICAEQTVYLTFDGDCLDPNSCPADYDMAYDDLVDVIIK